MQLNSPDDPTTRYVAENARVMALERRTASGFYRAYRPQSVLWLGKTKLRELRSLRLYARERLGGRKWLELLRALRGSKAGCSAIVIGNGPSQEYLNEATLSRFVEGGGDVFAVNYWPDNAPLSGVAPSYLVISDPSTLKRIKEGETIPPSDLRLREYLAANQAIKIACPISRSDAIAAEFGRERVVGFIDSELRLWSDNISPLKPRGYISMTLYKALALALHFGYSKVFVLGMDNTYPRNIYCDENNRLLNLESHAGVDDWAVDIGGCYGGMGDLLVALSHLFYDLRKFRSASSSIVNLDPYSLTDVFPKARTTDVAKTLFPVDSLA
jgi:hypothetical protein